MIGRETCVSMMIEDALNPDVRNYVCGVLIPVINSVTVDLAHIAVSPSQRLMKL